MRRAWWGVAVALALLVAAGAWWWRALTPAPVRLPDPRVGPVRSAPARGGDSAEWRSAALERRDAADALHAKVLDALARRTALASPHPSAVAAEPAASPATSASRTQMPPPSSEEQPATLEARYIRQSIQDLQPLIAECYQLAMHAHPSLGGGRLVVGFEIAADEQIGGVVVDPQIIDTSTIADSELEECVRETMYTAELPAPRGHGMVTVRYPFVFSRGEGPPTSPSPRPTTAP